MSYINWKLQVGMVPCLSIRQPWTWLLTHGVKDIENRDWSTSYRGVLLLHAGKVGDENYFERDTFLMKWWQARYGVIKDMPLLARDFERGGIVGIATLDRVVTSSTSKWFIGTYGFVLRDAKPLPFIPYSGQRGLFGVPSSLVECGR